MRETWNVCPSLELKDSCSPWDLGGPRNGGLPLVTLGLSAAWHLVELKLGKWPVLGTSDPTGLLAILAKLNQ